MREASRREASEAIDQRFVVHVERPGTQNNDTSDLCYQKADMEHLERLDGVKKGISRRES